MFFLLLLFIFFHALISASELPDKADIARREPLIQTSESTALATSLGGQPDDEKKVEANADDSEKKTDDKAGTKIKIKPYGFLKNDLFWDTRQVFGFRENDILFWPRRYLPDVRGRDINAHPQFHILPIETLLGIVLTGPKIRQDIGAQGVVEIDFAGTNDFLINQVRMRHAYLQLDFDCSKSILITGQYWHPLLILQCYPETISFNFGEPFDTQARQPQIRYIKKWEHFQIDLAAVTERDFQSFGPVPLPEPLFGDRFLMIRDSIYKRNAAFPDFDIRLSYITDNYFVGGNFDYKRLVPRIVTNKNIKVAEHIDSFIAQVFFRFVRGEWSTRCKFIFQQNGPHMAMPGGYALETINPVTDYRTYSPINWVAIWLDTSYVIKRHDLSLGLFIAGAKNLGARHQLFINPFTRRPVLYGHAEDIDNLFRVSPRLVLYRKPFAFGVEFEITRAAFGSVDRFARVHNTCPVTNFRILLATYYIF